MSSPVPPSTIPAHLATFLQRVEQRKMDAKMMLRSQVEGIVDDFFGQLVAEFTAIIRGELTEVSKPVLGQLSGRGGGGQFQKVESVVCEPIIEMCLLDGGQAGVAEEEQDQLGSQRKRTRTQGPATPETPQEYAEMDALEQQLKAPEKVSDSDSEDAELMAMELTSGEGVRCPEEHCEATFQQVAELQAHIFQVHPVANGFLGESNSSSPDSKRWTCSICSKVMKNERTLYMHQWRYHKAGSFRCSQPNCDYIASYRIQLRTHHIRFHDLGKFTCPFPGCGRSFNRRNSLKRHERIHLRLKPYRCKVCEYASELRSSMIDHVRVTHFRLPRSRKEQAEMNIGDDRDPADYFEVISEGLDLLEPVLEHVNSVLSASCQVSRGAVEDSGGAVGRVLLGQQPSPPATVTKESSVKTEAS